MATLNGTPLDDTPAAVQQWHDDVIRRGHRPTRYQGELAEAIGSDAYNTRNVRYVLAPASVRAADGAYSAQLDADVRAGKWADVALAVLQPVADVGSAVLGAPRQAIAEAVGLPPNAAGWLLGGAVVVGGYLWLRSLPGGRR